MAADFYFTWSKQKNAPRFEVLETSDAEFITSGGARIFDFISTNFQAAFGHKNKLIAKNISKQLNKMPLASPKAVFNLKTKATKKLIEFLKLKDGKIFYTVSGAEAIENALKIGREVTGKKIILARKKSYHGATLGALSVTGDWRGEKHFSVSKFTVRIPEPKDDPDLKITTKIIEKVGANKIAAFVLETISAMNGVIIPNKKWWSGIQKIAKEKNILLIIDEISTGFGRTGANFAFHHYNLKPDIVCMAKAITSGYIPLGALWTSGKIAKFYENNILSCGLTNYAHPLALAAMMGVFENLQNKTFQKNKNYLEVEFSKNLEELKKLPSVKNIRQKGLLAAIEYSGNKKLNWKMGLKHKLHFAIKDNLIILAPPFVPTPKKLIAAFESLKKLIS